MNDETNSIVFESGLSRPQRILGWCYVPTHMVILPVLLSVVTLFAPVDLDEMTVNVLYYAVGLAFTLFVMGSWLRYQFDTLLDKG